MTSIDSSFLLSQSFSFRTTLQNHQLDVRFPERFIIFQMKTIEIANKTPENLSTFLEKIIGTFSIRNEIALQVFLAISIPLLFLLLFMV